MSEELCLAVRDLSVAFRSGGRETLAVDRVSFDIVKGQCMALVGESGSGKSVTALSILRLLPYPAAHHPSGSIHFHGKDLLKLNEKQMRAVRGDAGRDPAGDEQLAVAGICLLLHDGSGLRDGAVGVSNAAAFRLRLSRPDTGEFHFRKRRARGGRPV